MPARGEPALAGKYRYHGALAAYFDDEQQHEAARMAYQDVGGNGKDKNVVDVQVRPCDWLCSFLVSCLLHHWKDPARSPCCRHRLGSRRLGWSS